MYKLSDKEKELLNKLLLMKDWNAEDGYSKEEVIKAIKSDKALNNNQLNQIRNYVMDKNLEYGFEKDGEPNQLGYDTEELSDKLYWITEES
ncbi:MAG: hypothetical protein LUF02_00450 [Erysipelotrichaceae bacterium]|nr:hypothetical protein [Erysipelotrichaceae bacterium]